ncbi:Protein tesmin/TSO1-like CXC [Dirofilaria immitis]
MLYYLLIFLMFHQLQKNNAEMETTTVLTAMQTTNGVTETSILVTTKGTQCLVPLTTISGWLTLMSILYEVI